MRPNMTKLESDRLIRFICPLNEQQITVYRFSPNVHDVRVNEGLSLTNAGGPAGDGCELTEDENDKGWHGGFGIGGRETFQACGNNAKRRATAGLIKRIVSSIWQHYANAVLRTCIRALCIHTHLNREFHVKRLGTVALTRKGGGRGELKGYM